MSQLEPQPSPPEQGSVMVGRFEMFGAIASGGFASIHLGRTVGAGGFAKMVAIKRLHKQFVEDREITKMFLDEARLVARIQHPNVVPTIDFIAEGGELFMVMEYIEGATLAHLLQELEIKGHRIPLDVTLRIMSGALHGLHAAHEARDERGTPMCVIHRDVSPDNVLVGVDGYPRILDFGVAKALGSYHATRDGLVKGKMAYLTPEQVMGKPLTRRTDVFSAAVVMWQCLAGRQLFTGDHLMELAVKVMQEPLVPPSAYNPGIPPKCDLVVMRGLERDPEQRWQSAELMAEAVEDAGKLATPARVGKWVKATAAERLANRASKVAAVELTPTGTEISADELSDSLEQPGGSAHSGEHAVRAPAPPQGAAAQPEQRRRGMAADDDETTTLFSMGERDFKAVTTQVMSMPRAPTRATYVRPAAGSPAAAAGEAGEPGDVPTRVRIAPAVAAPPPAAMALQTIPLAAAAESAVASARGSYPGGRPPPSRPDPATVPMAAVPVAPVTLPQATVPMPAVPSAPGSEPAAAVEAMAALPSGSSEHEFASGTVDPQALVAAEPARRRRRPETSLNIELLEGARSKGRYVPWLVAGGALAVVAGGIAAVTLSGQPAPPSSAASVASASPQATSVPAATAAAATTDVAVEPPAPQPSAAATAEVAPSAVAEAPVAPPEPTTAAPPEPAPTQGKHTAATKPAQASGASAKTGATKGKGKSEDDLFSRK